MPAPLLRYRTNNKCIYFYFFFSAKKRAGENTSGWETSLIRKWWRWFSYLWWSETFSGRKWDLLDDEIPCRPCGITCWSLKDFFLFALSHFEWWTLKRNSISRWFKAVDNAPYKRIRKLIQWNSFPRIGAIRRWLEKKAEEKITFNKEPTMDTKIANLILQLFLNIQLLTSRWQCHFSLTICSKSTCK